MNCLLQKCHFVSVTTLGEKKKNIEKHQHPLTSTPCLPMCGINMSVNWSHSAAFVHFCLHKHITCECQFQCPFAHWCRALCVCLISEPPPLCHLNVVRHRLMAINNAEDPAARVISQNHWSVSAGFFDLHRRMALIFCLRGEAGETF